jgi:hypothetical protein
MFVQCSSTEQSKDSSWLRKASILRGPPAEGPAVSALCGTIFWLRKKSKTRIENLL